MEASTQDDPSGCSRREFIGSAALTSAGAVAGLSFYFLRHQAPDLSLFRRPENRVGLGYIGIGNRGMALLRSSVQVPGAFPVAVADVRRAQRDEALKHIGEAFPETKDGSPSPKPEAVDDYRRLLDMKEVEAVFIATPHYLHGPMAMDAIDAGKHVYCEKAMAFTIGENQDLYHRITAGAKSQGGYPLVFQVGHQRHYSPLYQRVRSLVEEGTIGDVVAIRAQWNGNDQIRRPCADPDLEKVINWRLYSEYSGGLTTEFASHQVDVANWMLGTHPDSVTGCGGVDWYLDGRDTTDNIHLIYNYRVPVLERDAAGRMQRGIDGRPLYKMQGSQPVYRNVRFSYMSIWQNEHLGPSELILGQYGTLEVSLQGGEFFKERKARLDPNRIAEGTNPNRALQKRILRTGSTVDPTAASIPRKKGEPIFVDKDRSHWVEFTKPIQGSYDTHETLLATGSFLECVRRSRRGDGFQEELKANVEVGLWGAVPCLMANMAMREGRTVYWSEFFPGDETASVNPRRDKTG